MPHPLDLALKLDLNNATKDQLIALNIELKNDYQEIQAQKLNLDLTRGKPSSEQLSLSDGLDGILKGHYLTESGVDTRNYGGLEGIKEARQLGANILGMPVDLVYAGGNSSLTLMHQTMVMAYHFGLTGKASAWAHSAKKHQGKIKFLCPVPGYDRHFSVCEHLGIDMIPVPMTPNGPDMDTIELLISSDKSIMGMWCVPKYSNPTGIVYDDPTVTRIAQLGKIANPDFRVFWDNAYAIHDLTDTPQVLANIYQACKTAGTEDSVIQFASTSKITHAGSGVSFLAASESNLAGIKKSMSFLTIGPDKTNQLRHVKFFAAQDALHMHMKKHAAIIKPRFEAVLNHLHSAFADNNLGRWESAQGGYFISFDTQPGLAKAVVKLASDAGVKLTPAGATFPYRNDPDDSNIRIAPTVPSLEQVNTAMKVFVKCVQLASVSQKINIKA